MEKIKKRILYVDDDIESCRVLAQLLTIWGYEVEIAQSFADGLNLVTSKSFDLYILDNWFKDGSGIKLCETIRISDQETPVIFLSAAVYESDHRAGMDAGAQFYFNKPVEIKKLEEVLAQLFN